MIGTAYYTLSFPYSIIPSLINSFEATKLCFWDAKKEDNPKRKVRKSAFSVTYPLHLGIHKPG